MIAVIVVMCIHCLSLCTCIAEQLDDVENCDTVVYYVLLRAVDRFHSQMNRYPGLYDEHVELDMPALKVRLSLILRHTLLWAQWRGSKALDQ